MQPETLKKPLLQAIASAFLLTLTLSSCAAEPQEAPDESAAEEVLETTAEPEKELSLEQQIDALKIEAGQTPEAYAKTLFEDRIASWSLAGKDTYWEEYLSADSDARSDYALEIKTAEEQKNIYANALFHPGWQNNLSILADQFKESNEITLLDWRKAHVEIYLGGAETPDWEEGMVVERVELLEEDPEAGTRKLYIAGYETNNGAETANSTSPNVKLNGKPWDFYITTVVIDGTEYISEWSTNG